MITNQFTNTQRNANLGMLDKYETSDIDRTPQRDGLSIAKKKLTRRLEYQIALLHDPDTKGPRGRPVSPWWFAHEDGEIYTHVRFGTRPMQFSGGKAFRVGDVSGLEAFYRDVIAAIAAGELDREIEAARKIGIRGHRRRHGRRRGRRRGD